MICGNSAGSHTIAEISAPHGVIMPLPAGGDGTAGIESCNRFAVGFPQHLEAVSYTHLRAHETPT